MNKNCKHCMVFDIFSTHTFFFSNIGQLTPVPGETRTFFGRVGKEKGAVKGVSAESAKGGKAS